MRLWEILSESAGAALPDCLAPLADRIRGKRYEAAKRIVVATTGSIRPGERFDDDIADAVFLRIQRNAQVGRYDSEEAVLRLGRNAKRLDGPGTITVYRAAPKGAKLRPGDFVAATKHEAGFYKHGGHTVGTFKVSREDLYAVDGTSGGGQEYVYLPRGHQPVEPPVHFPTFRAFYDAVAAL